MTSIYKWVRIYQIDGKLEFIEATPANKEILKLLEKSGDAIDVGSRRIFIPPKCPSGCGSYLDRAEIRDSKESLLDVKLFCSKCRGIWDQGEV